MQSIILGLISTCCLALAPARRATLRRQAAARLRGVSPAASKGRPATPTGNIFAVNFQQQQTIGRVTPEGKAEVFVELPGESIGNGIRFDRGGA